MVVPATQMRPDPWGETQRKSGQSAIKPPEEQAFQKSGCVCAALSGISECGRAAGHLMV